MALGTTTSHSMRNRLAPMLRADQTSTWSLPRAPLKAPMVTGQHAAEEDQQNLRAVAEAEPQPVTGISADFGIG